VLVFLLLLLPIVEIWLLVQIGHHIGVLPTLGMLIATAIIGVQLARAEGLRVLQRLQLSLAERRAPEHELIGAFLVFLGGVLLVVPGVITDVAGILLLLPPTRALIARLLRRRWERAIRTGRVVVVQGARRERSDLDDEIIDVEAEPVDHERLPPPPKKE
jgi:UPF0716 protein FxsA